ncbi:alpha/beta family hydrolase [Ideonella sp.]|uniref:alpha/beta family hydrolase n=1 Tax=Ideonella sp. TaxID=1929293 RepID=UPI003BB7959C
MILLFVGRDDWQKDEALNAVLFEKLKENDVEILWEDPAAEFIQSLKNIEQGLGFLPAIFRRINLRLAQVIFGLRHPSYFIYLRGRRNGSVQSRCESLKKTIRDRGVAARTIVISRSSGGRVASLIADQMGLKQLVCLGYPFRRPGHGDEPERYSHLASLQTPMLIIQGKHDAYGGLGIEQEYVFSDKIECVFIDTDHNFDLTEAMAHELVELIENATGLT